MNVLVVEDDVWTAASIRTSIEGWNHDVETLITCRETIKRAKEKKFDLVLLDIFLPDGQGHRLIPQLKCSNHHMGIVTMTGYNSRELELEVRQQGISFYLIKPFSIKELKGILDHMEKRKRKEENGQ